MPYVLLNDDRSERIQYNDPAYPIYVRGGRFDSFEFPDHWHNDLEWTCVQSGEMDYLVNGKTVHLCAGEGIFVNAGQMHGSSSSDEAGCSFFCVLLHPTLLCGGLAFERELVRPLLQNAGAPYLVLRPGTPWQAELLACLRQIHAAYQPGGRTAPLHALAGFARVLALLLDNLPASPPLAERQSRDLEAVRDMVGYIQKNYAEKLTLAGIAAAGAVGQSKCCKLFGQFFSRTPNEYLTAYRLDKSAALLAGTDLSVTEVALATGFGSASYFAGVFRRWAGQSPTAFRRERQAGKTE